MNFIMMKASRSLKFSSYRDCGKETKIFGNFCDTSHVTRSRELRSQLRQPLEDCPEVAAW